VVRADEKLTAFLELELAISRSDFIKIKTNHRNGQRLAGAPD
jgi:hypothetical protein